MRQKMLISSFIVVIILIIVSTTSAISVKTDNEKENKPVDSNIEIISYISGDCITLDQPNLFFTRNLELGIRTYMEVASLAINPLRLIKVSDAHTIIIPLFIGITSGSLPNHYIVRGIAIGNIECLN